MDEHSAQRTLVKSPPELWAEVSDLAALARHLGEFGEIRITRLEPETTVAWEGDRARGTVRLEPSGWGTRVTLTAEVDDAGAEEPAPAVTPLRVVPEPEPEPEPEPPPAAAEVGRSEPAAEPRAEPPTSRRRSLLARLFRRRRAPAIAPEPEAVAAAPEPVAPARPAPEPVATPQPEPVAPARPEPIAAAPERDPAGDHPAAVLTRVLDDLGAAHHRPFSRA